MILGGDIGGTKTNLGLFETSGGVPCLVRSATFGSEDFPGLAPMLAEFLAGDAKSVQAACFGVAGPVLDNRTETPNLAWDVDGPRVAEEAGLPSVFLINDLVATAQGLPLLQEDELAVLHPGEPDPDGNRVLIAAGTGLGMALLPRVGDSWMPVASEGGHADFAPRDEEESGLLLFLRQRLGGRVSVERVVSGPGLYNVYEYLRQVESVPGNPDVRKALESGEDPVPLIGEAGLTRRCGLCARALDLFAAAYGAAAGNLALTGTATGGVYLGGGIAPKILPKLRDGGFVRAFLDKGRFAGYMERVPVRVILNDRTAMLGAARCALAALA
ncbi:MAG TPA: glucokinase [Thermoanaerobaculia bacterium]|nr:glucokinase [Thermoanaerobaculia bacterium]